VRDRAPLAAADTPYHAIEVALAWDDIGALGGTRTPDLLIRSSGQVVQGRPVVSALWTDVPGLSSRADSWLWSWQQSWQQLAHHPLPLRVARLPALAGPSGLRPQARISRCGSISVSGSLRCLRTAWST
jgi:hypothetical protein